MAYISKKKEVAAQEYLAQKNLSKAWEFYGKSFEQKEENIVANMVLNLAKYGSLSEKQLPFLEKLLYTIEHRAEIEAKRAEEKAERLANRKPMVEGERITVSAKVVKAVFGTPFRYGARAPLKITLVDDNYGLLWFQSTSDKVELKKGDTFIGTLQVKKVLDTIAFGCKVKVENVIFAPVEA